MEDKLYKSEVVFKVQKDTTFYKLETVLLEALHTLKDDLLVKNYKQPETSEIKVEIINEEKFIGFRLSCECADKYKLL